MLPTTEQMLADMFTSTSAEKERELAIALVTHLNEFSAGWSFVLREPNSTALLTPPQFVTSASAVALLLIGETCYVWVPKDRTNIDMLMLE